MEIKEVQSYYWRNRLTILKKIADKKRTPDGRKEFTEYQRKWAEENAGRKRYYKQRLTAKDYSRSETINTDASGKDQPGKRINPDTPAPSIITEMPPGWKRPASDFTVFSTEWN
jgi:hypothetical protein